MYPAEEGERAPPKARLVSAPQPEGAKDPQVPGASQGSPGLQGCGHTEHRRPLHRGPVATSSGRGRVSLRGHPQAQGQPQVQKTSPTAWRAERMYAPQIVHLEAEIQMPSITRSLPSPHGWRTLKPRKDRTGSRSQRGGQAWSCLPFLCPLPTHSPSPLFPPCPGQECGLQQGTRPGRGRCWCSYDASGPCGAQPWRDSEAAGGAHGWERLVWT